MDWYKHFLELAEKYGLPRQFTWLVNFLALPLIIFGSLILGLEIIGAEAPATQIWAACIALGFFWLSVCHHWVRTQSVAKFAVTILLIVAGVVFWEVWILHGNYQLRIPFLVTAALLMVIGVVLGLHDRVPEIARYLGLGLLTIVAALLPGDWYFLANSVLPETVPAGHAGILLAPYDLDREDKERANLRIELRKLIAQSNLKDSARVIDLPRLIPGYSDRDQNLQSAAARQIGINNGALVVAFGTATAPATPHTYIVSVNSVDQDYLPSPMVVRRHSGTGPTNDARYAHASAVAAIALLEIASSNCVRAEQYLANAAKAVQSDDDQPAFLTGIRMLQAGSIVCALQAGKLVPSSRAVDALELYDGVLADVQTAVNLRLRAGIGKGLIYRVLAGYERDPAKIRATLEKAVDAYRKTLSGPEDGANQKLIALAWGNLGVAYEKLALVHNTPEKLSRENLRHAKAAYDEALGILGKAGNTIPKVAADTTRAQLHANLGVTLYQAARRSDTPAADLEKSIEVYELALAGWSSHGMSRIPAAVLATSNLGDAYRELAIHKDATANLKRARDRLEDAASSISTTRSPAIRGEVLYKLGQVHTALGDRTNDESIARRGVVEWACALKIFTDAALIDQASTVALALLERIQKQGLVVVSRMMTTAPSNEAKCEYNAKQTLKLLTAQH